MQNKSQSASPVVTVTFSYSHSKSEHWFNGVFTHQQYPWSTAVDKSHMTACKYPAEQHVRSCYILSLFKLYSTGRTPYTYKEYNEEQTTTKTNSKNEANLRVSSGGPLEHN